MDESLHEAFDTAGNRQSQENQVKQSQDGSQARATKTNLAGDACFTQRYLASCARGRILQDYWFFEKVYGLCIRLKTSCALYNQITTRVASSQQAAVTDDDSNGGLEPEFLLREKYDQELEDIKHVILSTVWNHVNSIWYGPGLRAGKRLSLINGECPVLMIPKMFGQYTPQIGYVEGISHSKSWCPDTEAVDVLGKQLVERKPIRANDPFLDMANKMNYLDAPEDEILLMNHPRQDPVVQWVRNGHDALEFRTLELEANSVESESEVEEEESDAVIDDTEDKRTADQIACQIIPVPAIAAAAWCMGRMIPVCDRGLKELLDEYDDGAIWTSVTMGLKEDLLGLEEYKKEFMKLETKWSTSKSDKAFEWDRLKEKAHSHFQRHFKQDNGFVY